MREGMNIKDTSRKLARSNGNLHPVALNNGKIEEAWKVFAVVLVLH
jgi:hypothetical protein